MSIEREMKRGKIVWGAYQPQETMGINRSSTQEHCWCVVYSNLKNYSKRIARFNPRMNVNIKTFHS
jgi:hypothetical protein